ncbi:hypothetical protein Tco_0709255 [Tanacetum coccineum]
MTRRSDTFAERQVDNKRKLDNNNQSSTTTTPEARDAIAISLGSGKGREYAGNFHCATSASFIIMASALNQGHYKSDCPKLKTETMKTQAEGTEAPGMGGIL